MAITLIESDRTVIINLVNAYLNRCNLEDLDNVTKKLKLEIGEAIIKEKVDIKQSKINAEAMIIKYTTLDTNLKA